MHALGAALKGTVALGASSQSTTLLLEFFHRHGRESGGAVVLGLLVVDLVDGHRGVDH